MTKRWQPSEIHIMLTEYELVGSNGVQELLPHRSISAIQHRAKLLNLKMKKRTAKPNKSDITCNIFDDYEFTDEMDSMPIELQVELYRKSNPYHFVKVDLSDGERIVTFSCKKCGDVIKKASPDKDYTVHECEDCVKKVKNRNFKGLCKQNFVGRIFKGMEITAQYTDPEKGYLCDIKCAICGTEDSIKTGVPLLDVLDGKYFHDSDCYRVVYKCPNCLTIFDAPLKVIMDSKDICLQCDYVLDSEEIQILVMAHDHRLNFNSAIKRVYGTTSLPKMKQKGMNYDIFYEEVPIYRSLYENYYRCICIRHKTKLVLSETELINYHHTKCHDIQEGIFKTLKAHNLLRSINDPKKASAWKWDSELSKFVRRYKDDDYFISLESNL